MLSDSTGETGDHKKRLHYFKLPSLQYYVLVSQQAYKVEVYERAAGFWKYQLYEGFNTVIPLPLVNVMLPLSAMYEDVLIEEEED